MEVSINTRVSIYRHKTDMHKQLSFIIFSFMNYCVLTEIRIIIKKKQ